MCSIGSPCRPASCWPRPTAIAMSAKIQAVGPQRSCSCCLIREGSDEFRSRAAVVARRNLLQVLCPSPRPRASRRILGRKSPNYKKARPTRADSRSRLNSKGLPERPQKKSTGRASPTVQAPQGRRQPRPGRVFVAVPAFGRLRHVMREAKQGAGALGLEFGPHGDKELAEFEFLALGRTAGNRAPDPFLAHSATISFLLRIRRRAEKSSPLATCRKPDSLRLLQPEWDSDPRSEFLG